MQTHSLLCACVLSLLNAAIAQDVAAPAPAAQNPAHDEFTIGAIRVRLETRNGAVHAAVSRDGGRSWQALARPDDVLHFRYAQTDPLLEPIEFPGNLGAPQGGRLHVVQFRTQILAEYRTAIERLGAQVVAYIPENGYIVRCDQAAGAAVRALPCVRWLGGLQVGFKLEEELLNVAGQVGGAAVEYNVVLASKADRARLAQQIGEVGGAVTNLNDGSVYLQAKLTPAQLAMVAAFDTVTWIDRTTAMESDMDNARIQGGANYIEQQGGFTGLGVRGEITEGVDNGHPDWTNPFIVHICNGLESHGQCTAGIVFGNGSGNPAARGMLPNGQGIEASYQCFTSSVSRHTLIQQLVNPALTFRGMFQTASWGANTTTAYTSVSVEIDDAIFDADLPVTQSQSNTGNQNSRPQAWAKNIISVGGVRHGNNSNPLDDNWTGSASTGPAIDGRIKPDVCAYYDYILCADRVGSAGYTTSNYTTPGGTYTGFGGTSGATPIVAGHVGLIVEMFTDGLFHNPLQLPATPNNRFDNAAHFTTTKSLLMNTASQYTFAGSTHDLTRIHQGFGFPNLQTLYDNRDKILVVDEYEVLNQGQTRDYYVWIGSGETEFRVTMGYADPAAAANSLIHRINNLDLRVDQVGTANYWYGNNGLMFGNYSTSGGTFNDRDTFEHVILQNPASGIYKVSVNAQSVVADSHIETPQMDVDFALVVRPLSGGFNNDTGMTLDVASTGPGNATVTVANAPAAGWTDGYTLFTLNTNRALGFGGFFGVEADGLTLDIVALPATAGDVFHFTNSPGAFPFVQHTFPPAVVAAVSGLTFDAMTVLLNAGQVVGMSNVDRVTIQ